MSIRLTLKMRGEEGGSEKAQVIMLDDDVIVLGRDETCQVRLAQKAVSRNHARISRDGSLYFVEDLGSSFGTQVNGTKLPKSEKRLLRNGDTIAIAQFDVTFDRVAGATAEEEGGGKTAFLSRKVVKDVIKGLGVGGEQPFFRIMNGKADGQRIEISDAQEYVIGRDGTADIVLNDDLVSRRHVKVRRDWSGTHLEDLGSRNGFKVNRKKVSTKITLKDRDEVEVGNVKLLYIDPTEVREAPVVLPSEEEEGTLSVREDPNEKAEEEAAAEEPAAAEEEEAPSPSQESEVPAEASSESGPQASLSDGNVDASSSESSPGELGSLEDPPEEEEEGNGKLIDFSNKQTLIVLGVAAIVGLAVIVLVVLLIVGA